MNKKNIILFFSLVAIDQVVKLCVVKFVTTPIIVIPGFFEVTNVKNYGISFSMLSGKTLIILITSTVAMIFIMYLIYYYKSQKVISTLLFIILAGAMGNFIDRIRLGYVIDYLAFSIKDYDFAIFNLADVFVVCATFSLLIYVYFIEKDLNENNS